MPCATPGINSRTRSSATSAAVRSSTTTSISSSITEGMKITKRSDWKRNAKPAPLPCLDFGCSRGPSRNPKRIEPDCNQLIGRTSRRKRAPWSKCSIVRPAKRRRAPATGWPLRVSSTQATPPTASAAVNMTIGTSRMYVTKPFRLRSDISTLCCKEHHSQ